MWGYAFAALPFQAIQDSCLDKEWIEFEEEPDTAFVPFLKNIYCSLKKGRGCTINFSILSRCAAWVSRKARVSSVQPFFLY